MLYVDILGECETRVYRSKFWRPPILDMTGYALSSQMNSRRTADGSEQDLVLYGEVCGS